MEQQQKLQPRKLFVDFVKEYWEEIPGAGKLVWNWHLNVLCEELQTVAERVFENKPKEYDLVVNISPGTSKSSLASILFPAWTWTWFPEARHICASHTETLVLDLALKSRYVIESDKYRKEYPLIQLRKDQASKGYYLNTKGGARLAATVAGKSPTGFHAHFLIVDDPLDPKKAVSEVELKSANYFYDAVIPTRKVNKETAVTITIMQRLHEDDPSGHLLYRAKQEEAGKIRHICLPAEITEHVVPVELRDKYIDNLMDPVRLGRNVLKEYLATLGAYGYAGQFLQSPVPLAGGMFKEQFFSQRVQAAPYHARRARYWDRAATDSGGCFTAGVLIAEHDGNFYVEHVVHGQWEPDTRDEIIVNTAQRDRTRYAPRDEPTIYIEHEPGSSGVDAYKHTAKKLAGFPVFPDRPTGAKEVRAEPWASQCAAKNVFLVSDGSWDIDSFVREHCLFPMGKYKDQVDAASGSFNKLINTRQEMGIRILSPRPKKYKGIRIIPCSRDDLNTLVLEEQPSLLLYIADPPLNGKELPTTGLNKLLATVQTGFADIVPEDYQSVWDLPVEGFDRKPADIIMIPEHGKVLWSCLLKKRDPWPEVYVVADQGGGDRRALSLTYAICDALSLKREEAIWKPSDPEWRATKEDKPPNAHVYQMMKSSRNSVVF